MSGGRVELGLGAGWFAQEHAAYGVPFPATAERFDRLEEQLAIITGLWDTAVGDKFSFAGRHYELTDSPALPKPRQQPHPPIIIGGVGARRTPSLAARFADEFNTVFQPPGASAAQYARVAKACEAVGATPRRCVARPPSVSAVGPTTPRWPAGPRPSGARSRVENQRGVRHSGRSGRPPRRMGRRRS